MARKLDVVLVIDVESTCWEGAPPHGQTGEIIEIGICPLDLSSLERQQKHSILVKPIESTISPFCTQLTTLTPGMFENAEGLAHATRRLRDEFHSKDRSWASWGDYDRRQFERVCRGQRVGYPFGASHLNVKSLFAAATGESREMGLDAAYRQLGWELEGTHHRGDDDAWNIAGILAKLLRAMRATGQATTKDTGGSR